VGGFVLAQAPAKKASKTNSVSFLIMALGFIRLLLIFNEVFKSLFPVVTKEVRE